VGPPQSYKTLRDVLSFRDGEASGVRQPYGALCVANRNKNLFLLILFLSCLKNREEEED